MRLLFAFISSAALALSGLPCYGLDSDGGTTNIQSPVTNGSTNSVTAGAELCFVQITDTHLDDMDHVRRLERIIKSVNALRINVAFVAVTGDITSEMMASTNVLDRVTNLFSALEVPVHFVPGNHDILHKNAAQLSATLGNYTNYFGKLCYAREYSGARMVFIFTETLKEYYTIPGYDAFEELKSSIADSGSMPVIVFHHSPSVDDFYNNKSHSSWPDKYAYNWKKILNSRTNVTAVIAGHFHRDELHYIGGVPCYVAPSVAGYWKRQASYRIYTLSNGRLEYKTVYME